MAFLCYGFFRLVTFGCIHYTVASFLLRNWVGNLQHALFHRPSMKYDEAGMASALVTKEKLLHRRPVYLDQNKHPVIYNSML